MAEWIDHADPEAARFGTPRPRLGPRPAMRFPWRPTAPNDVWTADSKGRSARGRRVLLSLDLARRLQSVSAAL